MTDPKQSFTIGKGMLFFCDKYMGDTPVVDLRPSFDPDLGSIMILIETTNLSPENRDLYFALLNGDTASGPMQYVSQNPVAPETSWHCENVNLRAGELPLKTTDWMRLGFEAYPTSELIHTSLTAEERGDWRSFYNPPGDIKPGSKDWREAVMKKHRENVAELSRMRASDYGKSDYGQAELRAQADAAAFGLTTDESRTRAEDAGPSFAEAKVMQEEEWTRGRS